jgi:hypothetical protein
MISRMADLSGAAVLSFGRYLADRYIAKAALKRRTP